MQLTLSSSVQYVPRVGPAMAKRLEKLHIHSVEDLLMYVPFRYDDYSRISPIASVRPGEAVTLTGVVDSIRNAITKSGKKMQEAVVSDASGKIEVIWFNQPFLLRIIQKGDTIRLAGKVDWFGHKLVMSSPSYELTGRELTGRDPVRFPSNSVHPPLNMTGSRPVNNESLHSGRLVPIYPETEGVSSKWLRGRIAYLLQTVLPSVEDSLPVIFQKTHHLMPLLHAISMVHFPNSLDEAKMARHKLAFDEVFLLMLRARHQKLLREEGAHASKFVSISEDISTITSRLPFTLTDDQNKVIGDVARDLARTVPMNRLAMGDVGSGKTIVAAIAMYSAYRSGLQSLLMAPTQILAEQHFRTISDLLQPLGVRVGLVTGSSKDIDTQCHCLIGTHALLSKSMTYTNVGLIVIDEQHRFGVTQRQLLGQKGESGTTPHLLTMTATPIPRTVARTVFGNVDLSVITQMPKGRQKIKTWLVPKEKRENAYGWIKKTLRESGGQAYIVCPLIDESETLTSVRAVKTEYEKLKTIFQGFTLGLLHGRMKPKEKISALDRFRAKKDTILVATPVVEVGIDIPNAILILIEASERFGLAQLHQLRGRVGRGDIASYCLLFSDTEDELTIKRLKSLETIHNGPELADVDLALRGPGELFGSRQHGIPPLRIASFSDTQLLEESQRAVNEYLQTDPHLENPLLRNKLKKDTITITQD